MSNFVVINNNLLTEATKGGQSPARLNDTQSILRVNKKNEEILKEYIKYSSEDILALDKTKKAESYVRDFDNSGRAVTRIAITEKGWSFLAHFVECTTSTLGGIYCENYSGQVESQHYAKFYDSNGAEITDPLDMGDCVKSVFTILPSIDYEVVSGEIHQYNRPEGNMRLHSLIGAFMPNGAPISVKEFVRNLNLKFKDKAKAIVTDGRAPKLLRREFAGLPVDANQLQIVVNHEAGVVHELMIELEYYRE
jgi:hypothetical protein